MLLLPKYNKPYRASTVAIDSCKLVIDILVIHGNIPFVDSLLTFSLRFYL